MVSNAVRGIKRQTNNWRGNLALWLLLFLAVGYPIQASVPILLHLPSTPVNATFRGVYLFIALVLIINNLKLKTKLTKGSKILILFWVLYSIRLVVDVSFRGIKLGEKDQLYIYSFAFGSCFLPMIAVILNTRFININSIYKRLYGMVITSNLFLLGLIIFQTGSLSLNMFAGRMSIMGGEDENIINTITIGLFGNLLVVLSIYSILFLEIKGNKKLLVLGLGLVGLFNLVVAASRGPMVVMLITIMFMLYFKYSISSKKILFSLKMTGLAIVAFFFFLVTGVLNNLTEKFTIFSRFEKFKDDIQSGEKEARNYEYASAWNQFCDNPIIGDRFTTKLDGTYPHNMYLEVLMSLGLVGAVVFLFIHYEIIKRIRYIFKKRQLTLFLVLIILIILFLSAMTSGGIGLNPELWLILGLFLSIKYLDVEGVKLS